MPSRNQTLIGCSELIVAALVAAWGSLAAAVWSAGEASRASRRWCGRCGRGPENDIDAGGSP